MGAFVLILVLALPGAAPSSTVTAGFTTERTCLIAMETMTKKLGTNTFGAGAGGPSVLAAGCFPTR